MKILGLCLVLAVFAQAAHADVSGVWRTERSGKGGFSDVEFFACGSKTCGRLKTAYRKDGSVNKGFPGVGTTVIKGMSSKDGKTFSGGTLRHTETGKVYQSKMTRSGNRLRVSGCVAGGLLCQSVTLTKR